VIPISVNPQNLVQGPAILRYALFGATEPAHTAVASDPDPEVWFDVGGTADGSDVVLEDDLTYTDQTVDQIVLPVGTRLTKEMVQISATLEEATLENMQRVRNQLGSITTGSGFKAYAPGVAAGTSATQPQYAALMIDGWAPELSAGGAARRRLILRKCVSASKLASSYQKTKTSQYVTSWTGYWISDTVEPYDICDEVDS
jgi:hypothetical protein